MGKLNIKNIKKKYQRVPSPVKASIWFTVCSILQKGISFLTTPVFTRLLTTAEYGKFSVYQSWYSIIAIFATLNLSYGVFNNGMTKYQDRDGFASAMLGLSSNVTIVLTIVFTLFKNKISHVLELEPVYIYLILLECLLYPAFALWSARQRYEFKYKNLVIITLLMSILSPFLGIIFVINSDNRALARVVSFVFVEVSICVFFYIKMFKDGKIIFSKKYWKYALLFNIPLLPHYLSQTVLNQADRIMIGNLIGKSEAAIYSVAYSISMMMIIVTTAINNSFIPYTYQCLKNENYKELKKYSSALLMLVCIICIMAMAFCPEIILIVGGQDYYDAVYVMPPIAASVFFMFLYPLFANIEFYYEETRFVAVASCIAAVFNVVLNYVFINIFGYYAAGYTTLVCYIVSAIGHYFFSKKLVKKNIGSYGNIYCNKWILITSFIVLLGMVCMIYLYQFIFIRYCIILMGGILIILCRKKIRMLLNLIKNKRR